MIIVITGPTCLGKSETALKVAQSLNAEIINGDAFQSYKEMDIGVAKPSKEYFSLVPHHLYSFVNPNEPYSDLNSFDLSNKEKEYDNDKSKAQINSHSYALWTLNLTLTHTKSKNYL